MEIEIVGNGQLGGERDLVEGMQLGTIEMASTANMVLSNFDPRFAVLDLPYLITDYETAYRVLDSDVIQDLQDSFAEQSGVRVLAYGQGGFRQVIGNVAVNSLADMHGMKVSALWERTPPPGPTPKPSQLCSRAQWMPLKLHRPWCSLPASGKYAVT